MEDSAEAGKTLRREIAASTRILQAQGILGYSGHVSARLPDGSGFLIQPRKTSRAEVTPEDILTVDNEGIQTGGPTDDTPPGEVAIHVAILKARPEMGAVIHFHPKAATLFSMVEDVVLAPMKNHAYRWRSGIPVHPDSSHIKTASQGEDLAKTLGPHMACLLRAHGAVLVAEDIRSMMIDTIHFEENAEAFIQASVIGTPKLLSAEETLAMETTFDRDGHISKLWQYYLGLAREQGVVPADWNV